MQTKGLGRWDTTDSWPSRSSTCLLQLWRCTWHHCDILSAHVGQYCDQFWRLAGRILRMMWTEKGKRNEALSLAAWTRPNTKTCRFVFFVVFQKKMKNMSLIINSLRNIALMWTHGTVCVSLTGEMTNRGKDAKMSQLSALFPQICHRRYLQKVSHKYH